MKTITLRAALISALMAASTASMALPTGSQVDAAIASGDFKAAESMLRQVVADKPSSGKAWLLLAQSEAKLGNRDLASQAFEKAKAINPNIRKADAAAFDSISGFLASSQAPQLMKVADTGALPSSAQVEEAIRAQNWRGAENMLEKVVAAKPGNAKAWYYLAQTEEKLGNAGKAVNALNRAEQADASLKFASPGAVADMHRRLSSMNAPARAQNYNTQQVPGYTARPSVGTAVAPTPLPEKPSSHAWIYILATLIAAGAACYYLYNKKSKQKALESSESARKALLGRANNVQESATKLAQTARFEGQESSAFGVAASALVSRANAALSRLKPTNAQIDPHVESSALDRLEADVEALETQAQRKAWDEAPIATTQRLLTASPDDRTLVNSAPQGYPSVPPQQQGYAPAYGAPGYAGPTTVVVENNSGTGLLQTMIVADALRDSHHSRDREYDMQRQLDQERAQRSGGGAYAAPSQAPAPAAFDLGGSGGWDNSPSPAPAPFDTGSSGSDSSWDNSPAPSDSPAPSSDDNNW